MSIAFWCKFKYFDAYNLETSIINPYALKTTSEPTFLMPSFDLQGKNISPLPHVYCIRMLPYD